MKFLFDRDALLKELTIAQEIISSKNAISILSNVMLVAKDNTLLVRATDLQTKFETRLPVEIQEEGATTVFCDKFVNSLATFPEGETEFLQDDINVVINPRNKKTPKFTLKSMASEKYPEFTFDAGQNFFDVPAKEFKNMLSETVFSVSNDITRYFMTGVYMEKLEDKLNFVGTDGRRLAFVGKTFNKNIPDFPAAIVPPKILNIILKRAPAEGNIAIAFEDKQIHIKFGNYEFASNLIDGKFPNYQRVIPESFTQFFEVDRNDLTVALKRVGIMVEEKSKKIIFELTPGALNLWSAESDMGSAKEEILCEFAGEPTTFAFPVNHIGDPLRVIETDRIRFEFTTDLKPVVLRCVPDSDFFYVVMPMQV